MSAGVVRLDDHRRRDELALFDSLSWDVFQVLRAMAVRPSRCPRREMRRMIAEGRFAGLGSHVQEARLILWASDGNVRDALTFVTALNRARRQREAAELGGAS